MSATIRFQLEQLVTDEDARQVRDLYLAFFRRGCVWGQGGFTFFDGFQPSFSELEMEPVRVVGGGCELPRSGDVDGWRRVGVDVRGFLAAGVRSITIMPIRLPTNRGIDKLNL